MVRKKARNAKRAALARAPMTMPAVAPALRDVEEGVFEVVGVTGVDVGVEEDVGAALEAVAPQV